MAPILEQRYLAVASNFLGNSRAKALSRKKKATTLEKEIIRAKVPSYN